MHVARVLKLGMHRGTCETCIELHIDRCPQLWIGDRGDLGIGHGLGWLEGGCFEWQLLPNISKSSCTCLQLLLTVNHNVYTICVQYLLLTFSNTLISPPLDSYLDLRFDFSIPYTVGLRQQFGFEDRFETFHHPSKHSSTFENNTLQKRHVLNTPRLIDLWTLLLVEIHDLLVSLMSEGKNSILASVSAFGWGVLESLD